MFYKKRILAILVVSSLLVACGGGGGSSTGNHNDVIEQNVSVKTIKEISFRPELSEYSASLDKIIAYDRSLATLNIVNRLTGTTENSFI